MPPIVFLSVEDVVDIHADTLQHEGGMDGVRDPGLLESAVMMPQQKFGGEYLHENLAAMAAAYLFHLAQNHPFLDGNKRVSAVAAYVFLYANGVEITAEPDEFERISMGTASGEVTKAELTNWFGQYTRRRADR